MSTSTVELPANDPNIHSLIWMVFAQNEYSLIGMLRPILVGPVKNILHTHTQFGAVRTT